MQSVFIPLEFKDDLDIRPLWWVTTFEYLDRAWEWVQVTSEHVANHYNLLAVHGAAKLAPNIPQN